MWTLQLDFEWWFKYFCGQRIEVGAFTVGMSCKVVCCIYDGSICHEVVCNHALYESREDKKFVFFLIDKWCDGMNKFIETNFCISKSYFSSTWLYKIFYKPIFLQWQYYILCNFFYSSNNMTFSFLSLI